MSLVIRVGDGESILIELEDFLVVLNNEFFLDSLNDLGEQVIKVSEDNTRNVSRVIHLPIDSRHYNLIIGVKHGLEYELETYILGVLFANHIQYCLNFILVGRS